MEIIIVYNSKTGFTKRYVDWIAEEIKCEVQSYNDFIKTVKKSDKMIIFCSRIHAGKIEYLDKMKLLLNHHSNGKFIVVATGGTPNAANDVVDKIWENNFTQDELKTIPHFYMQAGLNYEKMGMVDWLLMKMAAKIMSRKKKRNDNETGFGLAIQKSHDITSKEYIKPLIEFIDMKMGMK